MLKLTIPADTIKALLTIAPKHDVRYYLNGIAVDYSSNGTALVAADGHRLLAVAASAEVLEMCDYGVTIIPRDTLAAVKGDMGGNVTVTIDGAAITVAGATTATCQAVDGRYPNWRTVTPRTVSGEVAQFNAEYLGDWGKVGKLLNGKKGVLPVLHHNGTGAARVSFRRDDVVGVIMPCHLDDSFTNPAWLA